MKNSEKKRNRKRNYEKNVLHIFYSYSNSITKTYLEFLCEKLFYSFRKIHWKTALLEVLC